MTAPPRKAELKDSRHAADSGVAVALIVHRAFVKTAIIMPMYPLTMLVMPPTRKEKAVRVPILKSQPPEGSRATKKIIKIPKTTRNARHMRYSAARNALAPFWMSR